MFKEPRDLPAGRQEFGGCAATVKARKLTTFPSRAGNMSRVESPAETLIRFTQTPGWLDEPLEVLASDLLTPHHESNLEWDFRYYEERDGVLWDPVRKRPIVGTDGGDPAQKEVNRELQDWFLRHDSGIAVRISPRGSQWRYPEEQLAIHRIAYKWPTGQKVLLIAFHQFNANFVNPEQIRRFIFTEDDSEEAILEIINWLRGISQKRVETVVRGRKETQQQAVYYASLFKSGVPPEEVVREMAQTQFLGNNPIGCAASGQGAANIFGVSTEGIVFLGTEDQFGPLEFTCPKCGSINVRPPGHLISNCQHCGADVSC
ncbi:MAG: hypothetical protein ACOYT7_03945 [Patescibacteria group bacterium]